MKVILSLDTNDKEKAHTVLKKIRPKISHVKIGHIPLSLGTEVISAIIETTPLFLDIKLHDIPNTMEQSIRNYRHLFKHLDMITIWGDTQEDALRATVTASEQQCKILSVIQLTSTTITPLTFLKKVEINLKHNITWFITPPSMLSQMRQQFGNSVHLVSPGIRLCTSNDHKITFTPTQAKDHGCEYIVVGRPIMEAIDPQEAIKNYQVETS